jgi:hypothetical protein
MKVNVVWIQLGLIVWFYEHDDEDPSFMNLTNCLVNYKVLKEDGGS